MHFYPNMIVSALALYVWRSDNLLRYRRTSQMVLRGQRSGSEQPLTLRPRSLRSLLAYPIELPVSHVAVLQLHTVVSKEPTSEGAGEGRGRWAIEG